MPRKLNPAPALKRIAAAEKSIKVAHERLASEKRWLARAGRPILQRALRKLKLAPGESIIQRRSNRWEWGRVIYAGCTIGIYPGQRDGRIWTVTIWTRSIRANGKPGTASGQMRFDLADPAEIAAEIEVVGSVTAKPRSRSDA